MTQDEATRLESCEALLDDFGKLPSRVERPRTFMEIAGYPHYENACSNILAFFMDPEESHGLGTLVLDALARAVDIDEANLGVGGNVSVEREVHTDAGNRIDILITSDDHTILIENKIHAAANNPFDDYAAYLDKTAGGRGQHKILLTLDSVSAGGKWGFANLTHEKLVEQIRSLLGHYISNADARYLTMFLDFLNTLESLKEESRMDRQFINLLAERSDDIEYFLTEVTQFKEELRRKVRELGALIELEEHNNVWQWFYREKTSIDDDLVHDIRISEDLLVAIDTGIGSYGWNMFIWARQGDRLKLQNILQNTDIHFEVEEGGFSPTIYFAYDEDLERIRPVLQDLVDRIAASRECEVES